MLVYYACAMGIIKKNASKKKRVIVLILISSLVAILGIVAWWYFSQSKVVTERTTQKVTDMSAVNTIAVDGRRLIAEKNIKGGEAQFDAALQSAQDDGVELQLLLAKIDFYVQANEVDKAIVAAKDADKRLPGNIAIYSALGNAYELKGQTAEAITEYRRALSVLGAKTSTDTSKPAASRSDPRVYYEARIKELEQ
jgi:tetratricopeptide (TPR) repeat protein